MTDTTETWKPVVGYEGFYEVSDQGRVRSVARQAVSARGARLHHRSQVLRGTYAHRGGYQTVALSVAGERRTFLTHRLVAFAFLGDPAGNYEVNHKNGNKRDNSAANLEWVTHRQNTDHAKATGLLNPAKGEAAGKTKLSEWQVRSIRQLLGTQSHRELARIFSVSPRAIRSIQTGRSWSHLE